MPPLFRSSPLDLTAVITPPLWFLAAISLVTHPSSRPRTRPLFLFLAAISLLLAAQPLLTSYQSPHLPPPVSRQKRQQDPAFDTPVLPLPLPTPSPSPTPRPIPSTPPPLSQPPSQIAAPLSSNLSSPPLSNCRGGLRRMQAVLLLELCIEILLLFLRCFAEADDDDEDRPIDVTMRGYIFVRAIYTIPVLLLNAGIYWVGGGPTGACLSAYSENQIAFTHLIFYVIYCCTVVVLGVYRIDKDEEDSTTYDTRSPTWRSDQPPTRTSSSFFDGYPRRRRHHSSYTSSSYVEPKFRVNLGCCALNF